MKAITYAQFKVNVYLRITIFHYYCSPFRLSIADCIPALAEHTRFSACLFKAHLLKSPVCSDGSGVTGPPFFRFSSAVVVLQPDLKNNSNYHHSVKNNSCGFMSKTVVYSVAEISNEVIMLTFSSWLWLAA